MRNLKRVLTMAGLGLALSISSQAFSQAVRGSGGTGFTNAVVPMACVEGNRNLFRERDPKSGNDIAVVRTCRNGSYYDLSDYIYDPHIRCKNGRTEIWNERDPLNDHTYMRRMKCVDEKWVENND